MQNIQNEIRMIWLMVLIMIAVGAWFLDQAVLSYLALLMLVISVMQYVDAIEKTLTKMADRQQLHRKYSSKIPLYLSSIVAFVGGFLDYSWLMGLGASAWVFFFLAWLSRLEHHLNQLRQHLALQEAVLPMQEVASSDQPTPGHGHENANGSAELSFIAQVKQWVFQGNPVLKVAIVILLIGVILLLRFATEHWQLSLALQLGIVALISIAMTGLGYRLRSSNRSFALALQGLGLAGLFLSLFFAYYNHLVASFGIAALLYLCVMLLTLSLSLRQQALELALMAIFIAYIAPFSLPIREITAVELLGYYVVVNSAVAILTSLRAWKILNQIAFLMTVLIGGGYAVLHFQHSAQPSLLILILLHSSIFIWLSFRFSQLLAQRDLAQFKLKPALDVALIFSVPIIAYACIYLLYFQQLYWQAGISLGFALLYALLFQWAQRDPNRQFIAQNYFSLMLIFLSFIPPILLPEPYSIMGWAIEGALIFILALIRKSAFTRYLAMGLLLMAACSGGYHWIDTGRLPTASFWLIALSYLSVVVLTNSRGSFQQQLGLVSHLFLAVLNLAASGLMLLLGLDYFQGPMQWIYTLLISAVIYNGFNEWMIRRQLTWSWLLAKYFALLPLMAALLIVIYDHSEQGMLLWSSWLMHIGFAVVGLLLSLLWLRPMLGLKAEKEWISLGALLSLAAASLTLIPSMPWISSIILPLLLCGWSYYQRATDWALFWQAKSTLLLMLFWMVCSQLLSQQAFQAYVIALLNPFDLVSLAVLVGFLWILSLQIKAGLDKGIAAMLAVLSVLWLTSYMVLRALHHFLNKPYNSMQLWQDAMVQLCFTLLWVSLAFVSMSIASRKQLRSVWILGGSILVIVSLKLVLLDLSHIGTLMRVMSFLGAGLIMLIIAYIAPMPEPQALETEK